MYQCMRSLLLFKCRYPTNKTISESDAYQICQTLIYSVNFILQQKLHSERYSLL